MLNALTIEELLALKLELSTRSVNTPLVFLPLYKNCNHMMKEALLTVAILMADTKTAAADMLGISKFKLDYLLKRYSIIEKISYYRMVANDDKNDIFN